MPPGADDPTADAATDEAAPAAEELAPLLELRDGLPPVVDTPDALAEACDLIAQGTGPVAIDAERASGYRYSGRAYLVQLRREGSGSLLIDPVAFADPPAAFVPMSEAIGDAEWILHAANQDLACLAEIGLRPHSLFDTELAGRLLGFDRVGLGKMVEDILGFRMRKEHSAQDWSTRPLPPPWLEYAALDVEVLLELREELVARLEEQGKTEWARQEFEALLDFTPAVREDPWRRLSGLHKVRGRRFLAAARELWHTRDQIAAERDVTPGRILPDSAVVAAAQAMPRHRGALMGTAGFRGRGASRYSTEWLAAIERARELDERELPPTSARSDGPPPARAWVDRDPEAAGRLAAARAELAALSEQHGVPVENLTTPDYVRRVLWEPPVEREPDALAAGVAERLSRLGARAWQVDLVGPVLVRAILEPTPVESRREPAASQPSPGPIGPTEPAGPAEPGTEPGTEPDNDPGAGR